MKSSWATPVFISIFFSADTVTPSSVPSPMCADAQIANLLNSKLIRSRLHQNTLDTRDQPNYLHLVPFVLARGWP